MTWNWKISPIQNKLEWKEKSGDFKERYIRKNDEISLKKTHLTAEVLL